MLLASTCLTVLVGFTDTKALAGGPVGGNVVAGQATITAPNANSTLITQATQKAVINWQDFSISSGATVQFAQPNASAIALNRVIGPNPSSIEGNLLANGQVWIINGSGVLFGKGAQVNVGSLIATTADINNADFMNGNYNFGTASANPNAAIVNNGTIKAGQGGTIVLAGPVVQNNGLVQADAGNIVLGGANTFTVDFQGDNLIRFQVGTPVSQTPVDANGNAQKALVSNSGTLSANGGRIVMTARAAVSVADNVINNTGMIEANSVRSENGTVILDAGPNGEADVAGTVDASGKNAGETGGSISVTGGTVKVADGAKLDASGDQGGGTIAVGGNLHGAGPLANAQNTTVGKATLVADATSNGNGGTITVWSSGNTKFAGAASARGGANGGNGGTVETSGTHLGVDKSATVDTSAPRGNTGNWLLDPSVIVIESIDGGQGIPDNGTVGVNASPDSYTIDPSTIVNLLDANTTNVTLEASQEIDVYSPLNYTSSSSLSLLSQGDIVVAASVQNAGTGAIMVVAGWDGSTTDPALLTKTGAFGNNGNVYVTPDRDGDPGAAEEPTEDDSNDSGNVAIGSAAGTTTVEGTDILVQAIGGYAQIGYHGDEGGGGAINVLASGNLELDPSGYSIDFYAMVGNGTLSDDVNGSITGDVVINVAGATNVSGNGVEGGVGWIGNANPYASQSQTVSGNVTLVSGSIDIPALGDMVAADLGTSASTGGNVTIGITGTGGMSLDTGGTYSSPHALSLLSAGDITVSNSIQNNGTGDINLVAGWDGKTTDPSKFTNAGVFGKNDGSITIGGPDVSGNVAIGSKGGNTLAAGANVTLDAESGYAQIGYVGSGTTGAINVLATGDISVTGSASGDCSYCYAQIGSGGFGNGGDNSGAVTVNAGGDVTLSAGSGLYSYAQIGNGGEASDGTYSGDVSVTAGGDVTLNSAGNYTQIGNGGWGVSGDASGNVTVNAGGDVTLTGDSENPTSYSQIGNGGQQQDGSASGTINVTAGGALTLTGGAVGGLPEAQAYAQIGNGAADNSIFGDATGDITINVAGETLLQSSSEGSPWIGNVAGGDGTESGNVTLVTGSLHGHHVGAMFVADLSTNASTGGNVTVGITSNDFPTIDENMDYSSPHTLSILSATNVEVLSSIQNSGTGAINLVAGWDGQTLDPAKFTNAGVYGNNGGAVLIGGGDAEGDSMIGSAGGATTVAAGNVFLDASNGLAQIGFNGYGGGDITVDSTGTVAVVAEPGLTAQIGNGAFGLTSGGNFTGNITVNAGAGGVLLSADHLGVAQIGNGGTAAVGNASGKINVTSGGDVTVATIGQTSSAQIGNGGVWSANHVSPQGNASGNITVDAAGQVRLLSNADNSVTHIGNGGYESNPTNTNASDSGNISVTGASIEVSASLTGTGAHIGNGSTTSDGNISGNVSVAATSGDVFIQTPGSQSIALVGNIGSANSTESGTVNVGATGEIALLGDNANSSIALVGNGNAPGTNAQSGNVTLTAGSLVAQNTTSVDADALTINVNGGGAIGTAQDPLRLAVNSLAISANGSTANLETSKGFSVGVGNTGIDLGNGNLTMASTGTIGQTQSIRAHNLNVTSTGGAIALANAQNAVSGAFTGSAAGAATFYDADGVTIAGLSTGGDATVLSKGSIGVTSSILAPGSSNVTLVAGWDGTTTAPGALTNAGVYGNNGGNVTIGGNGASGGVAVGSANGTTLVEGANVTLAAVNGYAMIGAHGAASDAITVNATGNVTLSGGAGANDFAQIGNGGQGITGNDSGAIAVTAGGGVALDGGAGAEAYAQIGNGGAESNVSSNGYTNSGAITVKATNATLAAGSGNAAYAQIGNGGFKVGAQLQGGTATNTGDISVVVSHAVALNGNGNDAYAQIGNGGDQSNLNASASSHGLNSGNITVAAPNGPNGSVTMTAGNGTDAYAEIGNGGFSSNASSQAIPANFIDTGNISVTDLTLAGGNGGAFSYAQIGNGDAAGKGLGDVSGNITIDANGNIVIIPGTAPGSGSSIGNDTGFGTISGTVTGFVEPQDAALNGTVSTLNSNNTPKNPQNTFDYQPPPDNGPDDNYLYTATFLTTDDNGNNAIAALSGGDGGDGDTASDSLTLTVAKSLSKSKGSNSDVVIIGLLRNYGPAGSQPHGVPPADQEYSSWGNEALWQ